MLLDVNVLQVFWLKSENSSPLPAVGSPMSLFEPKLLNISSRALLPSEHFVRSCQVQFTAGTVLVIELLHFRLEFRTRQFVHDECEAGP